MPMIIFSPAIQFQMTMLNFTALHKVKVMEPNENKYLFIWKQLIVCEKTYLEVDFFHFAFQFLTGFLNLSHFSVDMEIHEGNMAKDQDGTQQDKNKSQKCGLCSYSSKWPSTLKCHMMVHICYKDFTCKQCDYSCAHADKLKQHILTHSGEKPFKCSHCNFSCTSQ